MKKHLAALVAALALAACLLGLVGCGGSNEPSVQGEWLQGTSTTTVVFTDSQIKMVGVTFDYSVSGDTIDYSNDSSKGSMTYELSEDGNTLTTTEDQDGTEVSNTFYRISNDTNAEPQSNYTGDVLSSSNS